MTLDGATLPTGIELTSHGCGENFPEVPTADGVAEQENRRVELFFFDSGFGVQPKPPGKTSKPNSTEYPEWRRRALQTHEFDLREGDSRLLRLKLLDSDHEPLAGMSWTILHDFGSEVGETDAEGLLVARLPSRLASAVLVHEFGSADLSLDVLPPVEQTLGAQLRLSNLGYDCDTDGNVGPATQEATTEFQEDQGLSPSGTLDTATINQLRAVYGQ